MQKPAEVLVLRDPEVWTWGPEPVTPPFVRVDVASITAWWLSIPDALE
jgi:hypothetical protein